MQFVKTINTAAEVIKALSDPKLGPPASAPGGQAAYTFASAPATVVIAGRTYTANDSGGSVSGKHCLGGVVGKNNGITLPAVGSAENTASLTSTGRTMHSLRNAFRSKGLSANRVAEAQAVYDSARSQASGITSVKALVAIWLASASAFHNGGSCARIDYKLLA